MPKRCLAELCYSLFDRDTCLKYSRYRNPLMTDIARSSYQGFSHELVARLVNARYLQPALRKDADAIAHAIAKMKQDLRGRGVDDDDPAASA